MFNSQLSPTDRFERVLLSTDGSKFSRGAEQMAIQLTRDRAANLFIMKMLLNNIEFEGFAPEMMAQEQEMAFKDIERIREELFAGGEVDGMVCTPVVRYGRQPHEKILELVDEVNADLVVMGRRGGRGLARMMVGLATSHVVGKAPCKVLVVPQAAAFWKSGILLATDGFRYSDSAGIVACRLAQIYNLPLVVLSVTKESHSTARRQEATLAVERVAVHARSLNIAVEGIVAQGRPEEVIIETAHSKGCDLIVGGSHGRTGIEKILLGSTMDRVIGKTLWPVMVVK